jgi:hypothetical protein
MFAGFGSPLEFIPCLTRDGDDTTLSFSHSLHSLGICERNFLSD